MDMKGSDLNKAIFIDVEMRKSREVDPWDNPPIVGVLIDGEYTAYACKSFLETSVAYQKLNKKEQNWKYSPSTELVFSNLIDLATREGRKIVAYSNHEKKVMNAIFPDKKTIIKDIYVDANMKNWFKKNRGTTFRRLKKNKKGEYNKSVGLKDFLHLDYVDYEIPNFFKGFSPAAALSRIEKQIATHGSHSDIKSRRKSDFTNLYTYNLHDCKGMEALLHYVDSRT